MSSNISAPSQSPVPLEPLDSDEQTILDRVFSRNFVFENIQREWDTVLRKHREEIAYSASVAKAQLGGKFGGLQPTGTQYGITLTRAPFFGIGKWLADATSYSALGDPQQAAAGVNTWLSKANLSGTSADTGTPLVVGKYAVHCILALGDFSSSPVIESIQETLNGNPQPVLVVEHQLRNSDLKYVEFDTAKVYVNQTTFIWQYNADLAAATAPYEEPYFFGVSFLPFTQLKLLAATSANFNGTTSVDSIIHY